MQIEGTRAAFLQLLSERGVYKKLGVDRVTVATWKRRLADGSDGVSLDKMEEMLIKAGASVVSEKVWEVSQTKGRTKFTQDEIEEIARRLDVIRESPRDKQKILRGKLRAEMQFFISDFEDDQQGFTSADLRGCIKAGQIQVI